MSRVTRRRRMVRLEAGGSVTRHDTLVVEEPLEIRLNGRPLAVTMRTPGSDFDLAAGFLVSEGVIGAAGELVAIRYCAGATTPPSSLLGGDGRSDQPSSLAPPSSLLGGDGRSDQPSSLAPPSSLLGGDGRSDQPSSLAPPSSLLGGDGRRAQPSSLAAAGENTYNVLDAELAPDVPVPDVSLERNVFTSSSCGVCGKASLDAVRTTSRWSVAGDPLRLDPDMIATLPDRLREAQAVFESTGGLHAAGLFTPDGELVCVREDVGRHNAVDKLVGWALREDRLPLAGQVLLVSGRASFELAQKAVMAGIPAMCAVSAPSSLAVELAADAGLTLVGFLRGDTMNVYSGAERLGLDAPVTAAR